MINDETVTQVGHESHVRSGQGIFSLQSSPNGTPVRSRPGILVFSRRQQLLHANHRALELTSHFRQAEHGPVNDVRSAPVRELSAQIQEVLDSRRKADISERFELTRVIFEAGRKILARGFGLSNLNAYDDSHIVIVLEEIGFRQERRFNRRRPSLLRAVATSPRKQHDGDPKEE